MQIFFQNVFSVGVRFGLRDPILGLFRNLFRSSGHEVDVVRVAFAADVVVQEELS